MKMGFELFKRTSHERFKGKYHTLEKRKQMSESHKGHQGKKGILLLNVYELIKFIKLEKKL